LHAGIGGGWGAVKDEKSYAALNRAVDLGVNFVDTADVYGGGRSERLIGKLLKERKEEIFVATKAGRRLSPHTADGYNRTNLESFVDRTLTNLGLNSVEPASASLSSERSTIAPKFSERLTNSNER